MGKKDKEHRKKIAKRNESIKQQQKSLQKAKDKIISEIIKKEQEQGKFNNNPSIDTVISNPGPQINGPQI